MLCGYKTIYVAMKQTLTRSDSAIFSEEQPASFKRSTFGPATSDQILVHNSRVGIPLYVEKATKKVVLQHVMDQHRRIHSRLSTASESLFERIIIRVVNCLQLIGRVLILIIEDPGFLAPVAVRI